MAIGGLDANTTYYFAMKASDEVPNVSSISNVASATTLVTSSGISVPLLVEEHHGIARTNEVVSMGVPFAVGTLYDDDLSDLHVVDSSSNTVPAQIQILNRWWSPHYDDSIRWLQVIFPASVAANGTSNYTLCDGSNANPSQPVEVTTDSGLTTVTTGAIKVVVNANNFSLFDSVWVDSNSNGEYESSEKVVNAASDDGLVIVSGAWQDLGISAGQEFCSSLGSATVTVEEDGPVRAVLLITGTLQRSQTPAISPYYEYQVRMYFDSGSPLVRCHVTLKNNRIIDSNVYTWPIEDFGVRTSLNTSATNYALLGQSSPVRGTLSGSNTAKIYQDSNGTDKWQTLSDNFAEGWLNPWNDGLITRGVTFRGYQIYDGASSEEQDDQARGWLDATNSTLGVAVGVKDFWQQYPKALRTDGSRVEVGLLPTEWSELFSLFQGTRRRTEVLYDFHAASLSDQQSTDLYSKTARPLFARCSPETYVNSNAWDGGLGLTPAYSTSTYDKYATTGDFIGVTYGWDWYGWISSWSSGGTHMNEGSMFLTWILYGDWRKFEQSENILLWTEQASALMFDEPDMSVTSHWIYLRSWPNIATSGVTENHYPDWYNRNIWKRPDFGHCGQFQNLEYYYLTGDRHALEDVLYYGQYSDFTFWDDFHLGYHYVYSSYDPAIGPDDPDFIMCDRYSGWPLWNLTQAYEASGDSDWLEDARLVVCGMRNALRRSPIKFAGGDIYDAGSNVVYYSHWPDSVRATSASQATAYFMLALVARPACQYYRETGDLDGLDVAIGFADFLLDVAGNRDLNGGLIGWTYCWADYWGAEDVANGTYPARGFHEDLVIALGYAWEFGRKAKYNTDLLYSWSLDDYSATPAHWGYTQKAVGSPPADMTPPAAIDDLSVSNQGSGTVYLEWTAPGNNGTSGTAAFYQVKYANSNIVERITDWPDRTPPLPQDDDDWLARAAGVFATQINFVQAWNVDGAPTPAVAGTTQSMTIGDLESGKTYYFAIKTFDPDNNISDLSNVVSITIP